ncbi:hypothetical protein K0M31_007698, partial [Melipona bicolor]
MTKKSHRSSKFDLQRGKREEEQGGKGRMKFDESEEREREWLEKRLEQKVAQALHRVKENRVRWREKRGTRRRGGEGGGKRRRATTHLTQARYAALTSHRYRS